MQVYVEGKISYRKYTGQDNVERNVTDIVANMFRILEHREGQNASFESRFPGADAATANSRLSGVPTNIAVEPAAQQVDGDDLPF
jgi:single-stranded DNA-binding protein